MDKDRSDSLTSEGEILKREAGHKRMRGDEAHEKSDLSSVSSNEDLPQLKASAVDSSSAEKHAGSPASSYLEMDVALNRDLFVAVNEVVNKESGEKAILLGVSNVRPQTHLGGNKQGDHVTAYIAYLHMLITAVEGENIQEAANIIVEAAKAILPDKAVVFDELLTKVNPSIDEVVSRDNRRLLIKHLNESGYPQKEIGKINESLKIAKRAVFMDVTRQIAEKFLKEINLDEEVAFARAGESDPAAGEREKKAIHTLKVINELEGIKDREEQDDRFDRIYQLCMKTSAQYVRGINIVFEGREISEVRKKWEYIKEWDAVIEQREGWGEKREQLVRSRLNDRFAQNFTERTDEEAVKLVKTQLVNELKQAYNEKMDPAVSPSAASRTTRSSSSSSSAQAQSNPKAELISKCFGDLFDFKYENHKHIYAAEERLYKVISRHLISMFRAFDNLELFDESSRKIIIDTFVSESILKQQEWEKCSIEDQSGVMVLGTKAIIDNIKRYFDDKNLRMFTKDERDQFKKSIIDNSKQRGGRL